MKMKVGIMARRSIDGSFLPAVPIYREVAGTANPKAMEEKAVELGRTLLSDYERYCQACKAAGRTPG